MLSIHHAPQPGFSLIFAGFRAGMTLLAGGRSPLDFIPTKRFSTMSMRPTPCLPLRRRREVAAASAPQQDMGGRERWVRGVGNGGQTPNDSVASP